MEPFGAGEVDFSWFSRFEWVLAGCFMGARRWRTDITVASSAEQMLGARRFSFAAGARCQGSARCPFLHPGSYTSEMQVFTNLFPVRINVKSCGFQLNRVSCMVSIHARADSTRLVTNQCPRLVRGENSVGCHCLVQLPMLY